MRVLAVLLYYMCTKDRHLDKKCCEMRVKHRHFEMKQQIGYSAEDAHRFL